MSRKVGIIASGTDVSVLVLGDAASGKSSLLESYIGGRFPADGMAPTVLDPVRLTPEANATAARLLPDGGRALMAVNMTLVDTNGIALASDALAATSELARVRPNAIILCYAADQPASLVRVVTYWLPLIRETSAKPHWPYIPVSLCGTKEDLFDEGADGVWKSAYRAIVLSLQQSDPDGIGSSIAPELPAETTAEDARRAALEVVLLAFPLVQGSHHVSASEPENEDDGVLGEVGSVLYDVAFMIVFPTFPLYRPGDDEVTPEYAAAIDRIFRILDVDRDGLLSRDEFTLFQMHVGQFRLPEAEIDAFFDTLADEQPDFVDVERRSLTPAGFAHTMKSTVLQGMTEQAWAALDAFGYVWGVAPVIAGGLSVAGSPLMSPGSTPGLYLAPYGPPALKFVVPSHRDACFILTTPEGVNLRGATLPSVETLRSPDARTTGAGYLAGIFWQFSAGKPTLDPDDVARIFSVTSSRAQPFGRLYPFTSVHNMHGGISLSAWLGLWHMLLATNPPLALSTLYELGFATVGYVEASTTGSSSSSGVAGGVSGRRLSLLFDPRAAVREDVRRSHNAPFAPATTRRIAMLGSVGAGKSTLIQHAIGGSAQMQSAAGAAAARSVEERAAISAFPQNVVVAPAPDVTITAADVEARRRLVEAADARPGALVITEWPAHLIGKALDEENIAATDAIIFVVDAASAASISFFLRWIEGIPDGVPTTVVATLHESRGKDANAAGLEILSKLCSDSPSVSLLSQAGTPPAVLADASGLNESLPSSAVGLSLQLFRFVLRAPDATTREVLKFVTLRCVDPVQDNPTTVRRRQMAQWQRRRRIVIAGALTLGIATAAAVVAADVGGARKKVISMWNAVRGMSKSLSRQ